MTRSLGSAVVDEAGIWQYDIRFETPGIQYIGCRGVDQHGNEVVARLSSYVVIAPPPTPSPTFTPTFTPTSTPTRTFTPIPTATPTSTPTSTATFTPSPTFTQTPAPTATATESQRQLDGNKYQHAHGDFNLADCDTNADSTYASQRPRAKRNTYTDGIPRLRQARPQDSTQHLSHPPSTRWNCCRVKPYSQAQGNGERCWK